MCRCVCHDGSPGSRDCQAFKEFPSFKYNEPFRLCASCRGVAWYLGMALRSADLLIVALKMSEILPERRADRKCPTQTGVTMKYMLSWTERPQGSPIEYENAQKRILEVFTQWNAPGNFKIELFVIRVGD